MTRPEDLPAGAPARAPRTVEPARVAAGLVVAACLPTIAALLAGLGPVLELGAERSWPLELASHFPVHYTLALTPALALMILLRRRVVAGLVAGCLALNGWVLVRPRTPDHAVTARTSAPATPFRLRVLSSNVHTPNTERQRLLDLIAVEAPDVVVALEVDRSWIESLRPLDTSYPHRLELPQEDNFGIAVYSKLPMEAKAGRPTPTGIPFIEARIDAGGRPLVLLAAHPLPPVRGEATADRDLYLRSLADRAKAAGGPTVVAGDLNATIWSPIFQELLERGGLADPREGRGILVSWPVKPAYLRIPIDHILAGGGAQIRDFRVGAFVGSDHYPVIADLEL